MQNRKGFTYKSLLALLGGALIWTLPPAAAAQSSRIRTTIDAGTTILVRTTQEIDTKDSDGRVYPGVVDQDVKDRRGRVVIPKGSDVELVVRKLDNNELALDLDSVMVNGRRYGVEAEQNVVGSERKEGIGANKRTGKYVGGGAVLGAIIGAIAGGGKGAAIGAGAGAAAGAGAQVLTRGKSVHVPAETLLTFRLSEPLRAGVADSGYTRSGVHYHSAYAQQAYNAGQAPNVYDDSRPMVHIGADRNITWRGPQNASVYVQVDNTSPMLFAMGASGTQSASWMMRGHLYTFILRDMYGNDIARDQLDLRYPGPGRQP